MLKNSWALIQMLKAGTPVVLMIMLYAAGLARVRGPIIPRAHAHTQRQTHTHADAHTRTPTHTHTDALRIPGGAGSAVTAV